jgi:predicted lipoprotein with Yx(FWY)xxD motif
MNRRHVSIMLAALAFATTLGACGSSDPKTPVAPQSAVTELTLGATSLGQVVTDANGRTLYMFTKDMAGSMTSACTGDCLALWPPAFSGTTAPKATGVTGTIGTIDVSGKKQVTLDGWPLHYYAQDVAAGDVDGQGVDGEWYVLGATGTPVKRMPDNGSGGFGY